MKAELKVTSDGSHTLYVEALDEHYHSKHGALQESMHVFIQMGLNAIDLPHIHMLEVGFGTGLNCFLTLLEAGGRKIDYTGLELHPVDQTVWSGLNYGTALGHPEIFKALNAADWEARIDLRDNFRLRKIEADATSYLFEEEAFDLVYFDAFAPSVQPELWGADAFEKLYKTLRPGGLLVTYSAKGEVRRTMESVGFEAERLPGPPGKREMLRAWKR